MTRDNAIVLEQRTKIEDLFKIYLIPENGWYRVYEWSAYLINHIPSKKVQENKPLKTTKKKDKNNENGYIFVGLREEHFPNFLPENFESTVLEIEGANIITIDVERYFTDCGFTIENYKETLKEYKNAFDYTLAKPQKDKNNPSNALTNDNSLINTILSFKVLEHTPLDCYGFIQDLQKEIINSFLLSN